MRQKIGSSSEKSCRYHFTTIMKNSLGASQGNRRRNVTCQITKADHFQDDIPSSVYPWRKARELEGRAYVSDEEGAWLINCCRVLRFWGLLGLKDCPRGTEQDGITSRMDAIARKVRVHHYFRVRNAKECKNVLSLQQFPEVTLSLEITQDWYKPPGGIIPIPGQDEDYCGSHAVALSTYDKSKAMFAFPNSWGEDWGDRGFGYLSPDCFDRLQIEAWSAQWAGFTAPVQLNSGIACLSWKTSIDSIYGVHGREIINASNGDRLAWAFAVRRGEYLDIEELFVWPSHRRKGYARILVEMLLKLAIDSNSKIRAWVPYADCHKENHPGLTKTFELLGLDLQPSEDRWAGYFGTKGALILPVTSIRMPLRPSSLREQLTPWQYTVWYGTN